MRAVPALLVLALAFAGCFGGGGKGGDGNGDGGDGTPSPSDAPGVPRASIAWAPAIPRAGDAVSFTASVANLGSRTVQGWSWTFGDGGTGQGSPVTHTFTAPGDWQVKATATLSDGKPLTASRSVLVVSREAGGVGPGNGTGEAPGVPPPGTFDCGGVQVVEPAATFGTDEALPQLAWAVLKTGFRLAVAWSSEQAATGSVTYSVHGGAPTTVTETVPTRAHLFVIDSLPENRTVCFTASMGGTTTGTHAVRTVNAMTAFEPGSPHGAYTVNLLVLANEGADLARVAAGLDDYAVRLWDATDGWVRSGMVLVVSGDLLHHNLGYYPCGVLVGSGPGCAQLYDVLFTNNADPRGAASTYRKGVRDPTVAVWMNQYHQAPPAPVPADDTGAVLVHEMGHYLFDMDDLYGDPVIPDSQDCDLPELSMSIMGGPRSATEFDDEVNRCPTQPDTYVPSWTLMRGEFPRIPDRAAPLPGPDGTGGLHVQRTYRAL